MGDDEQNGEMFARYLHLANTSPIPHRLQFGSARADYE